METMDFPATPEEFINGYSFKDGEEIYTNGLQLVPVFRVEQMLEHYFTDRGKCDVCDIKETGHGSIELCGNGWQVCIRRRGVRYDMVINHCGEQIAVPIAFCPECGAKLDAKEE